MIVSSGSQMGQLVRPSSANEGEIWRTLTIRVRRPLLSGWNL